jgi:hypothetical protein
MGMRRCSARRTKSHGNSDEDLSPIDWLDPEGSAVDDATYRLLQYALANGFAPPFRIEMQESSENRIMRVTKIFEGASRIIEEVIYQSDGPGRYPLTYTLFDAGGRQYTIVYSEEEIRQWMERHLK